MVPGSGRKRLSSYLATVASNLNLYITYPVDGRPSPVIIPPWKRLLTSCLKIEDMNSEYANGGDIITDPPSDDGNPNPANRSSCTPPAAPRPLTVDDVGLDSDRNLQNEPRVAEVRRRSSFLVHTLIFYNF